MSSPRTSSSTFKCEGSPSLDLYTTPNIGYQWPDNDQVKGYVCTTPPIGIYSSAKNLARCCAGELHTVTAPTQPGDINYPASCVSWCYVNATSDLRAPQSEQNPYGFSDFFRCVHPDANICDAVSGCPETCDGGKSGVSRRDTPVFSGAGMLVCGFVNDEAAKASFFNYVPKATSSFDWVSFESRPTGTCSSSTGSTSSYSTSSLTVSTSSSRTRTSTSVSSSTTTSRVSSTSQVQSSTTQPAPAATTPAGTGGGARTGATTGVSLVVALALVLLCSGT